MTFPELNNEQKFIVNTLKERLGQEFTEHWLLLRNKHFQNKAPIDFLLSENYEYFDYIINS
jgi:hypothetical protein